MAADPPRSSPSVDGWDDEGIEQDHDDDLRSIEDADPHSNSDRLGATGLSETENEEGIASSCGDKFKEPEMARVSKDTSDLVSGNYNKPSAMSAIRKVIKMCENHLAVGNVAQSHYRNVCRALVTEAMELSSFLARAWETKDDHNHAELQKLALIDWVSLFVSFAVLQEVFTFNLMIFIIVSFVHQLIDIAIIFSPHIQGPIVDTCCQRTEARSQAESDSLQLCSHRIRPDALRDADGRHQV